MGIFQMMLLARLDVQSDESPDNSVVNSAGAIDVASPTLDQLPLGSTRNTWPNIVRNKKNVIFCTTQFSYLRNREKCISDFVTGPLLD